MDSVDVSTNEPQKRLRPKKRTKNMVLGGVLLIVITLLGGFIYSLSQPANGVVTEPAQAAAKAKSAPKTMAGKIVSFQYPATIQALTPEKLSVGDVEKFMFGQSDRHAWQLAIQVKKIPSGLLADESGYNLRRQNPQQFEEQESEINGMTVLTMVDKTKTGDRVAFLTHNGLVATIALSGAESVDVVSDETWGMILKTWQWL